MSGRRSLDFLANVVGLLRVIGRRLKSHLGLVLAVWAGFTLAVALVVSIPIYAEAAGYRILLASLAKAGAQDPLPPFSLTFSYGRGNDPPLTWSRLLQVDRLAANLPAAGLDLPVQRSVRYAATDQFTLVASEGEDQVEAPRAKLAFLSDFKSQAQLVEGDWPAAWNGRGPVDVLVSETTAEKQSILVDDLYRLHSPRGASVDVNLPIRVAGTWRPLNPQSDYWFYPPETFNVAVIIPEQSFAAVFGRSSVPWISSAAWYTEPVYGSVRSVRAGQILGEIDGAARKLDQLLPGIALTRSPKDALLRHHDQVRLLTVTLALFSIPLLSLLLYFILLAAAMVVQRQQQEIAILRSRGSSRVEVIGLLLGEGLVLGGAAVLVGVPLGLVGAELIASTQSFLRFTPQPGPTVELLPASWQYGLAVVALAIPALLLPALRSSGRTIVSFKQERSRSTHVPLWRRTFLDILLLVPALYGYQQLRLNGSLGLPGVAEAADDPFRNPVLVLAPALLVFALALLALRLLPRILGLLLWLLTRLRGVALVMAVRFLVRTTQAYSAPVLLIALTLSLAAFTASMAATLDQHSYDRARYGAGADVRLAYKAGGDQASAGGGMAGSSAPPNLDYLLVPADEYLKVPGVTAATRVASSSVFLGPAETAEERGTFLGVDRQSLAKVLSKSWRSDYAVESLGALMNRLARDPAAALVPSGYAATHGLHVGDRMIVELNDLGETHRVSFVIAGLVNYFPTLYPENGPFLIGNLEYSFEQQGGAYPFEIWLDTAPGTSTAAIESEAFGTGLQVLPDSPRALLAAEMARPERQGLYGLLSLGFMAAALVTILGFLAHTLLSFQRRLVELGMLRAIGLATQQLAALLIYEQAIVIGAGVTLGTALGLLVSRLFVPLLRIRSESSPNTPPFLVEIAWQEISLIYGVAALLLVLMVVLTLALLRRMRIFEVVKLGEAV